MVSPSERWPSSRVSWNIRAAQSGGMRTRRPRPFTLVWRSLVERETVVVEGLLTAASCAFESETVVAVAVAATVVVVGGLVSGWEKVWITTSEAMMVGFGLVLEILILGFS